MGHEVDVMEEDSERQKKKKWRKSDDESSSSDSSERDDTSEVAVFATKADMGHEVDVMEEDSERQKKKKWRKSDDESSSSDSSESDDDGFELQSEEVDVGQWTSDDIYAWIMSVDKERFSKYTRLKAVLEEESLTGNDLMDITE
eukprot:93607_1